MVLVDTSVWVDHLRAKDAELSELLVAGQVLIHPFVIGEILLGNVRRRSVLREALGFLPSATVATDQEVLHFIEREALAGLGIGYVDAHLLASTRLTPDCRIWTRDKRLSAISARLHLNAIVGS